MTKHITSKKKKNLPHIKHRGREMEMNHYFGFVSNEDLTSRECRHIPHCELCRFISLRCENET